MVGMWIVLGGEFFPHATTGYEREGDSVPRDGSTGRSLLFIGWYAVGIALVWRSHDGQAGMGAFFGALFLGAPLGFLIGYGVEYRWSGRLLQVSCIHGGRRRQFSVCACGFTPACGSAEWQARETMAAENNKRKMVRVLRSHDENGSKVVTRLESVEVLRLRCASLRMTGIRVRPVVARAPWCRGL